MKNIGSYPNVRLRRNRKTEWSRRLVSENTYPPTILFGQFLLGKEKILKNPIKTMPGVYRYTLDKIEKLS